MSLEPDNLLEAVALRMNMVPLPLAESFFPLIYARAIMSATKLGVFEALAERPRTAAEVAAECGLDEHAVDRLLSALVGNHYLLKKGGRYQLEPRARWAVGAHRHSSRDKILLHYLEWKFLEGMEDYLTSGDPLAFHDTMTSDEWRLYQRGMRATVGPFAEETARRLRLPANPTSMLDIGGSHGYFSVCLCRRHPRLRSTILELPSAVEHAAPILAEEGMGDRVKHQAGNALCDDLGENQHDLVLLASIVHHFSAAQIEALLPKILRALKPGGVVAIYEQLRADPDEGVTQMGGLLDLYFGLTSRSGTWSAEQLNDFLRGAGARPRRVMRMRAVRDIGVVSGTKPAS